MKKGILGMLIIMESFFLLLSMLVALLNGEEGWLCFLLTALGTIAVGSFCIFLSRNGEDKRMRRADNFLIVSLSWIIFSIVGMVPFLSLTDMALASEYPTVCPTASHMTRVRRAMPMTVGTNIPETLSAMRPSGAFVADASETI